MNKREKRAKGKIEKLDKENKECLSLLSEAKAKLTDKELEMERNAVEASMKMLHLKETKWHLQKKVS